MVSISKTKVPLKLRAIIMDRDNHRCLWCGRNSADGVKLHVDHVLSEMFGGKTIYENLGTLCNECNLGKSSDYYGSLLLTTILLKAPSIFEMMPDKEFEKGPHPENGKGYDGILHEISLTIFKDEAGKFRPKKISSYYLVHGGYLISMEDPDTQIRISDKKTKAKLVLKNKLRDFLFENQGYIEMIEDTKLVFRKRKPE